MVKAVLDTNILVSAQLRADGRPALILRLGLSRRFQLCVSESLLEEYEEVLRRERFRLPSEAIEDLLKSLRGAATMVRPRAVLHVAADPEDDKSLECAVEAGCQYLVTGNLRHFPGQHEQVRVISPREFEMILAEELKRLKRGN